MIFHFKFDNFHFILAIVKSLCNSISNSCSQIAMKNTTFLITNFSGSYHSMLRVTDFKIPLIKEHNDEECECPY